MPKQSIGVSLSGTRSRVDNALRVLAVLRKYDITVRSGRRSSSEPLHRWSASKRRGAAGITPCSGSAWDARTPGPVAWGGQHTQDPVTAAPT